MEEIYFIHEIAEWLDSEMDYLQGVILFEKYSKNSHMKRLFPGREKRYAGKLQYELRKIASIRPRSELVTRKAVKPSGLKPIPEELEEVLADDTDPSLPKVIRKIISTFSKIYNQRSILHGKLKKVAPENNETTIPIREEIVSEMSKQSDRLDELHQAHKLWEKKQILPVEEILFPPYINPPKPPDAVTLDELTRERTNLQKTLSKEKNLLNFSSPTKQPIENPMPNGPKRDAVLKRIKEKTARLKTLTKLIDGFNQVS